VPYPPIFEKDCFASIGFVLIPIETTSFQTFRGGSSHSQLKCWHLLIHQFYAVANRPMLEGAPGDFVCAFTGLVSVSSVFQSRLGKMSSILLNFLLFGLFESTNPRINPPSLKLKSINPPSLKLRRVNKLNPT